MAAAPRFSIIIPTYGRQEQVAACLKSLAGLNYPREEFEVIVVNDGGLPLRAALETVATSLPFRLIEQAHLGPAAARNAGAEAARGEFLAFTDDDCRPHPDWLHQLGRQFATTPNCLAGGQTINALPQNLCATASQDLISFLYSYFNPGSQQAGFLTSNNLAVPAGQFRNSGGFDPLFKFAAAEDRDLCDRWLHAGRPLAYVPEAVVYHYSNLSLSDFCRQHFRYGRGAYQFHHKRAVRTQAPLKIEPPRFYIRLLTYPFGQKYGPLRSLSVSLLLAVSQVANAAGYFWERWIEKA